MDRIRDALLLTTLQNDMLVIRSVLFRGSRIDKMVEIGLTVQSDRM